MIISIVNEIVTDMSLPFYHGSAQFQNLIADEQTLPAIYLDQPITANYNLSQSGYTSATYPINVLFLFKSELDWTPEQHDTNCIQLAEAKIREFINRCEANPAFDLITNISSTEFINLFDCNVSGKTLSLTLQVNNQYSVCADASIDLTRGTVVNSDGSYNNVVGMGNTLELADISVTDSDGSVSTLPAMTDVVCTAGVSPSGIAYNYPQRTFQTTSYYVGDAAWNEANLPADVQPINPLYIQGLADNYTLTQLNAFGNYYRYTDQNGVLVRDETTYINNNTVIDHYTGREWAFNDSVTSNNINWADAIDYCNTLNAQGFDDWYMPTYQDFARMININGSQFGLNNDLLLGVRNLWTSNTDFNDTTRAVYFSSTSNMALTLSSLAKTTLRNVIPIRKRY
jgi:hypothetical protein